MEFFNNFCKNSNIFLLKYFSLDFLQAIGINFFLCVQILLIIDSKKSVFHQSIC